MQYPRDGDPGFGRGVHYGEGECCIISRRLVIGSDSLIVGKGVRVWGSVLGIDLAPTNKTTQCLNLLLACDGRWLSSLPSPVEVCSLIQTFNGVFCR